MLSLTHISDSDDERIAAYRVMSLRNPCEHESNGTFVADSAKVVEALLNSSIQIKSIFAVLKFYDAYADIIAKRNFASESLMTATPEIMESITGFRHHYGVMAVGVRPSYSSFSEIEFPAVGLCGVINPDNVGSIIRNCVGLGFHSLIVDAASCSPYLRRAIRVAMGATFFLRVLCRVESFPYAVSSLQSKQKPIIIGSEVTEGAKSPEAILWKKNALILFGSESKGLPPDILKICDELTAIPIASDIRSLNVASASAVILYAAARNMKANNM